MHLPDGNDTAITPRSAMPEIVLAGVNHTTAPVDLREKLALTEEEMKKAVIDLKQLSEIAELIIVSTCNRMEVIFTTPDPAAAISSVKRCVAAVKSIPVDQFESALYIHIGDEAVRHLFRVGASLDSMIVGEPQILGQIKQAYKAAVDVKGTGVVLNRLLHKTFSVAKRIRNETGIGDRAVSISFAAVELAKKIFGDLENKTILMVGAGEMAELAVEYLIRNRADGKRFVANRTFAVGVELARRFSATPIRFEEIPETLIAADIIISSTGAPDFVITREHVRPIMRTRKNRPLFFIDIAVPRDVDPAINRIDNAYVYDIDDLKGVIDENIDSRRRESIKAERIIDEAVVRYRQWYDSLDIVPTIKDLRRKLAEITGAELERTLQTLNHLSENDIQALKRMTDAMIKKILHDPMLFLKNPGSHRDKSAYIDLIRQIFKLEDD